MARIEPEEHATRTAFVERLIEVLDGFLAGRLSRAEVVAWAEGVRGPYGARAAHGFAHVVMESIINLDEMRGGEPVLREMDVRSLLEELERGQSGCWSRTDLVVIDVPAEQLPARLHVPATRSWVDGLGWYSGAVFASLATGRSFAFRGNTFDVGMGPLMTSIKIGEKDDPTDAISDLVEVLGLREREVLWWDPAIAVDALPRWIVVRQDDNGNRFECESLLSRSAAVSLCETMTARGHKQEYWVERAPASAP
jgi:hypothetical protein